MHLLSFSSDPSIFTEGSALRRRVAGQASLFESHLIIVLTRGGEHAETAITDTVRAIPTRSLHKLLAGFDALSIALRRAPGATVVTVQDPFEIGIVGLIVSRILGIPLQVQAHTDFLSPHFSSLSLKNTARVVLADIVVPRARCIRVVSERIARSIRARYHAVGKIHVLPVYAPRQDLSPQVREFFGFRKYVLMTSRLEPEKDIEQALRVFAQVSEGRPGLGLVIAGEGSLRHKLEARARKLRIEDAVALVGWRDDLAILRLGASALLCTSRYEGYGLFLLEAAEAGCPIVATDVGIMGGLIGSEFASIVPVGDEQGLVKALREVVDNEEWARARAGRLRAEIADAFYPEERYLQELRASLMPCQ